MPKGSAPNIVHTRTWAGDVVRPGRTKKQLAARFKNKMRENFPSTAEYRVDKKNAQTVKDRQVIPRGQTKAAYLSRARKKK